MSAVVQGGLTWTRMNLIMLEADAVKGDGRMCSWEEIRALGALRMVQSRLRFSGGVGKGEETSEGLEVDREQRRLDHVIQLT